jgi:uncharacterized protein (TIGR02246 family)
MIMNAPTTSTPSADEAAIRRMMEAWSAAVTAKDLEGITACYTADTMLYDAIPPFKTIGKAAIREAWANCLPHFPVPCIAAFQDAIVHVSGDIAIAHGLFHFLPTPPDHPAGQTWMRVTIGYRRTAGAWKVLHEHWSVPFNPMNNQAWFIKDPHVADAPDYGQSCA